jgi:hypothetical protein
MNDVGLAVADDTWVFLQLYRGSTAFAIPKSDSSEPQIKLTTFLSGLGSQHHPIVDRSSGHFCSIWRVLAILYSGASVG